VLSAPVLAAPVADPAAAPDGEASPVLTSQAHGGQGPAGTAMSRPAVAEASRPERIPAVGADGQEAPAFRPSHAEKTFDVPTTRRRPVVFEEDDDLDIPDFLK